MKLGVNIDHFATLRNVRSEKLIKIESAVYILRENLVDSVTVHLREDRRHINEYDVKLLKKKNILPVNLEIAATTEMQGICIDVKPFACCIVPEKRKELTTEGGLDVKNQMKKLEKFLNPILKEGIRTALFIDPEEKQLEAVQELGIKVIEIHTGNYAKSFTQGKYKNDIEKIQNIVNIATSLGIECHAGHGLDFKNVAQISKIPNIVELNVGYSIICESLLYGLGSSVKKFKQLIG